MKRWHLFLSVLFMGTAVVWLLSGDAEIANDEPLERPDPGRAATVPSSVAEEEDHTPREQVGVPGQELEIVVAPPAPDQAATPLSEEEEFAKLYGALSVKELEREREAITDDVSEAAAPILQQRFDMGIYEVLGYGNQYSPPQDEDVWILRSIAFVPTNRGTEIRRVELLDQECPELYAKLRKARWLEAEANRKRAELVESGRDGR